MPRNTIALLVLIITVAPFSRGASAETQTVPTSQQNTPSPAATLVIQIKTITNSLALSAETKSKYITDAVQSAILTEIGDNKDPAQTLTVALELAAVATKAAPEFAKVIAVAISSLPAIASIEGAKGQVLATVEAAAKAARDVEVAYAAPGGSRPTNPEFGGSNGPEVLTVSRAHP